MREAQIEKSLEAFIRQEFMAGREDVSLDQGLSLIEAGIIDSLGIFTLVSHLEERFGIKVESEDIVVENFETIAALRNLVLERSG